VKTSLFELPVATSAGVFIAHYSEKGLAGLDFPKTGPGRRVDQILGKEGTAGLPAQILRWHKATTGALKNVLAGRAAADLPPFDWSGKTDFQKSVWQAMLKISPGKTKSYGEIAEAIGKPKAVRAVGGACGANPIPVLVPCHRVLAANKKIGGFSSGLHWKRSLLEAEGVRI
jgi:O-6-methylguanine DNA methyltransferase